jgi:hypothetical protein
MRYAGTPKRPGVIGYSATLNFTGLARHEMHHALVARRQIAHGLRRADSKRLEEPPARFVVIWSSR